MCVWRDSPSIDSHHGGSAALGPRSTDTSPNKFFFTVKVVVKVYLNTVGACLSQLVDPKDSFLKGPFDLQEEGERGGDCDALHSIMLMRKMIASFPQAVGEDV